jgi:hypothetical protein
MKTPEQVRREMRKTPEGKLLWEYGYYMYDTESSARTVARLAAKDLAELKRVNEILTNRVLDLSGRMNGHSCTCSACVDDEKIAAKYRDDILSANASSQGRRK